MRRAAVLLCARRSGACPPTASAPRTPDVNVGSKGAPNPCKINAPFCAARPRRFFVPTLKSGGAGAGALSQRERPATTPTGPLEGQKKGAFILQTPVQDFPPTALLAELVPHSSHLCFEKCWCNFSSLPLDVRRRMALGGRGGCPGGDTRAADHASQEKRCAVQRATTREATVVYLST